MSYKMPFLPDGPQTMTGGEQECLDDAWQRWQLGKVTERGPFRKACDPHAHRVQHDRQTRQLPYGHIAWCERCDRPLKEIRWLVNVEDQWRPIGPNCRKEEPKEKVKKV